MPDAEDELITHRAIFDKLVALERLSIARDDRLDGIEARIGSLAELLEAWNAVRVGGKFLKWLAGLIGAVGVIAVAVKAGVMWK